MRLIGVVVGILPQNHRPHLGVGGVFQGVEDVIHAGVDRIVPVFLHEEFPQVLIIGLGELAV